jgi:hypothetical protein
LASVKRYFSRLSTRNEITGFVYCSVILAQSKSFHSIVEKALSSIRNQDIGVWPKSCDHESTTDVGWLLYSNRQQDENRLALLLSQLAGEIVGVKWKPVRTTEGFKKKEPTDTSIIVRALHIEGPADKANEIRTKLSKWYSSASTSFPDGTKMRLIPPFHTIISSDNKIKFGTLVARQEAINKRLATSTTWEFATNLTLDKPEPQSGKTLRQVLMSIPSSVYTGVPVFHSIDKQWRSENGVTFTFLPENESDGRMYVTGLIPYLRSINPWYLTCFTEDARLRHSSSIWDSEKKQLFSQSETGMGDNVYVDDEYNLSDIPTASRPTTSPEEEGYIEVNVPDVELDTATPPIFQESDSVSTFHPNRDNSISTSRKESVRHSVKFAVPSVTKAYASVNTVPTTLTDDGNEDGAVSQLSDTASRLSTLETNFNNMSVGLREAFESLDQRSLTQERNQALQQETLNSILQFLRIQMQTAQQSDTDADMASTEDKQPLTSSIQGNLLTTSKNAGGSTGSAGHGY